jgi:acyl-coenzyme A synthetase/AMP-(fatty) acid ligase
MPFLDGNLPLAKTLCIFRPLKKDSILPGAALGGTQKKLLQYVNRLLSVFKAVRQIEIVPHLAKTQTGKIKRYEPTKT